MSMMTLLMNEYFVILRVLNLKCHARWEEAFASGAAKRRFLRWCASRDKQADRHERDHTLRFETEMTCNAGVWLLFFWLHYMNWFTCAETRINISRRSQEAEKARAACRPGSWIPPRSSQLCRCESLWPSNLSTNDKVERERRGGLRASKKGK